MSKYLKKSLTTIILGFSIAWISSSVGVAFGSGTTPIYKNNQAQVKLGPLAIGKNSNPVLSAALEVPGTVITNGFISEGTGGIKIFGNLEVKNFFLDSLTATSTPTPVCADVGGNLINC